MADCSAGGFGASVGLLVGKAVTWGVRGGPGAGVDLLVGRAGFCYWWLWGPGYPGACVVSLSGRAGFLAFLAVGSQDSWSRCQPDGGQG